MRNIAKIVKDKKDKIYLKVYDKTMKESFYFLICSIGIEIEEKLKELSDAFSINLKEE